jgi:hypothetical protein
VEEPTTLGAPQVVAAADRHRSDGSKKAPATALRDPNELVSFQRTTHCGNACAPDGEQICVTKEERDMLLQTVRPNIVQSIRAYRVEDLQQARTDVGQHFLYANLTSAQSKQDVLDSIAVVIPVSRALRQEPGPLYDCMTDLVHKAGQQPGFVVVLEQLPDNPRFDRERASSCSTCSATPRLLGGAKNTIQVLLFFSVARSQDNGSWERATEVAQNAATSRPRHQERRERELRHEHAADEQRVRHGDVAQRA